MRLTDEEKVSYLANVACVIRADGGMAPAEIAALEEVRADLGAKKGSLSAALKRAESSLFVPVPCGSLPARISNLADMLFVAQSDGSLAEAELTHIRAFSQAIGVTSDQLAVLTAEAESRTQTTAGSVVCPKCNTASTGPVKFCPNCGAPLSGAPAAVIALDFDIPSIGCSIEFCQSTAANFDTALQFARSAPTFATCVRSKKEWYLANWPEQSFSDAVQLADLLSGIRNRKCYLAGVDVPWDELFGFVWCAREQQKAYKPILYCFGKDDNRVNPWGCRQAKMDWTEWASWMSYGQFKATGMLIRSQVWLFDKNRIRHELLSNLHGMRFCPNIRMQLVEAILRALPDEVEVSANGAWRYNRLYEQVPGSIKVVEVERHDGYESRDEYFADGVRPRGMGLLADLLKQGFREAGVSDVTPRDIAS